MSSKARHILGVSPPVFEHPPTNEGQGEGASEWVVIFVVLCYYRSFDYDTHSYIEPFDFLMMEDIIIIDFLVEGHIIIIIYIVLGKAQRTRTDENMEGTNALGIELWYW